MVTMFQPSTDGLAIPVGMLHMLEDARACGDYCSVTSL